MKYATLFSGIEAPSVAWEPLGWQPAFFSEIDAFPSAVLAQRFQTVPNLGDVTRLHEHREYKDAAGDLDLICGGSPCQSFSVAGLRGGLDDERGNLALVYFRHLERLRPRWMVWENVPGVLSSNRGRDFGTLLGALAELGYGFAYRILDAQYFGVPQRRRRVFLVGYFGDWRPAAAVLFERESLRRNPPPSRNAGKRITCTPEGIAGNVSSKWAKGSGGPAGDEYYNMIVQTPADHVAPTLCAQGNKTGGDRPPGTTVDTAKSLIVTHALRGEGFDASEDGTGRGTPIVPVMSFDKRQITSPTNRSNPRPGGPCQTLTREADMAVVFHGAQDPDVSGGITHPVGRNHGLETCVAYGIRTANTSSNGWGVQAESVHTLDRANGVAVASAMRVRRLTPRECERLQGFPDDWTAVQYRGKPAADGPRYKAIGNSMAVPVVRWIGERIAAVDRMIRTRQVA